MELATIIMGKLKKMIIIIIKKYNKIVTHKSYLHALVKTHDKQANIILKLLDSWKWKKLVWSVFY